MLPKSSKHYILPTAADLNLNPQLVEDVVAFYYSKLRNSLSSLDFYNIQVENLGTFDVKKKELPKLAAKYINHLSVLKTDTFRQMAIKKDVELKLKRVQALQTVLKEEAIRKKQFFKNKKNGKNKSS